MAKTQSTNKTKPRTTPKTAPNRVSVADFLRTLDNTQRVADCRAVMKLMADATGKRAKLWGTSIIGFGEYHYTYSSGREGDMPRIALSPRKQNLVLYIMPGFEELQPLATKLGKHKVGKSCLYVNRLDDLHIPTLKKLIAKSVQIMGRRYPQAAPKPSKTKPSKQQPPKKEIKPNSMNYESARAYMLSKPEAWLDYPFGPDVGVPKVRKKMFATLSEDTGDQLVDVKPLARINLKCEPNEALLLRDVFDAVIPGYHMNKTHWNTVLLDGTVPQGELERMIDNSYALVAKTLPKAERVAMEVKYGREALYGPQPSEVLVQ
jgi:predicted DNA-binding protein (MmcQ/YjbR family)